MGGFMKKKTRKKEKPVDPATIILRYWDYMGKRLFHIVCEDNDRFEDCGEHYYTLHLIKDEYNDVTMRSQLIGIFYTERQAKDEADRMAKSA
jgi:hypothetical protein